MNNSQEKPTLGGPPRHHRRRGVFQRLKRWWSQSWMADRWWHFGNWFFNWWHPPSGGTYPGSGYYGHPKTGRVSRTWRGLRHLIRSSWPVHFISRALWRLHDWWYPQTKGADPRYGHYGSGRRSRLTLLWRRVRPRLRHSAFGRKCVASYERLYEWWYPVLEDSYPYSGYYGRRRKSRPAVVWHNFMRWVRNSWLGERYRECLYRFDVWWYPAVESSDSHYPSYSRRRLSRPVLAYRRWRRWFRKTWVGREFGWILDEVTFLLVFLQVEVAQALSERRVRRFFSKKQNVAALAVAVLAVVAGYYYGKPQYRHYVETRYALQAEQFMVKGDFARAYLRVRQVMDINPDNVAACRVNAELADWANSPFALYWRQRTVLLAPTSTNRLALASTALKAEAFPYPTATKTLDEIEVAFRHTANYQMMAGALALKLGHIRDAEQHYDEAHKLQPENPVTRMSLAVVQLQSKDPRVVTDSRITLQLLNADGKLGILPLRSLVAESAAARDFARAEGLSSQVLTNAQASFGDRMLHLTILHVAGRTNLQSFLKETQQKALEHPAYVGELAAWLNQFGYASQSLTWIRELPRHVSSQGLIPLAQADSYVALGKWKELETYLLAEHWIGQDHIRIAMLTLAIKNQLGSQSSALAWDRAVRLAADAPTALNTLAQMALSWGWVAEAEQVLWHAAGKFPKQAWPLSSLQNIYIARRDTAGLRRVYQASMQQDPKDKLASNNFTMLSLLSGKDLPTAYKEAAELYASEAQNPVFASTYAFSLHLQGKTKEGIEVLRALKPEELANPAVGVYYGVMLAAVGEAQAAKDYLDKSAKAFLLPEEQALVTTARKPN